jgi:hypothetical protein
VTKEDSGKYVCIRDSDNRPLNVLTVHLEVFDEGYVEEMPWEIDYTVKTSFFLGISEQ